MREKKDILKRFFLSKVFFVAGTIVLILLVIVLSRKIIVGQKIDDDIKAAEEEISRLENKNKELNDFIEYLNTEAFLEQEARLKFDLQKPGESVLVIPEGVEAEGINKEDGQKDSKNKKESNFMKWWNYFFNK